MKNIKKQTQTVPNREQNNDTITQHNQLQPHEKGCDIANHNITLSDFNQTKPKTSNVKSKKSSSMKFPMPRVIKENNYPERSLNPLELINEMIDYYDNKKKPEHYEKFIAESMTKKSKKKGKKGTKPIMGKNNPSDNPAAETALQRFEEINQPLILSNTVTIPKRTTSVLPYIPTRIGIKDNSLRLDVLKDSGASHSLLEVSEFKKLHGHENMMIKTRKVKLITPNATTENAIQGEVTLNIYMTDISGEEMVVPHTFLLTNLGGHQKCILGYDFLNKEDLVIGETNKHIFLKQNRANHAVEIVKKKLGSPNNYPDVRTQRNLTLEANSTQTIELVCTLNTNEIHEMDDSDCIFQPTNLYTEDHNNYGLVMQPTLSKAKKISENEVTLTAIIINTNNEDICLKKDTIVGELENIENNNISLPMNEEDFNALANHITVQEAEEVDIFATDKAGIFTFQLQKDMDTVQVNSTFNRRENIEKETRLADGSIRTQLTSEIEDILQCETDIDPTDLLDHEEPLDIRMADFSCVPEEFKEELLDIVGNEMSAVWAKHKWDIGETSKIKHDIQTEEGKFVKDKKRQIPYPRLQYAKKAVNTLMKYKLVTPAYNSKWATNLVLVQKPTEGNLRDSTKASKIHNRKNKTNCTWRLTQDLRGVNAETKNIYTATLPTIDEIVSKCRNKIVTQLDINQAYFHIPLTDQSREKTSFYLNEEMYEWNRMTQGLAGAPHTFMKFMFLIFCDQTLQEYKQTFPERGKDLKEEHWSDFLSIYIDDLDIFSDTFKEQLTHVHAVLWILNKERCLLNPKKAKFMTTYFNCLGVTINTKENSISIDKKRAQAILSWPKPSSLLEVMSRIQSLNYLSKNLPKLKEIAYPLLNLLRTKEFRWEEEHQTSWEHLKQLIRMDIRLTIPNDKLEYVTSSDTSKIAVAGNLWNYCKKTGKLYLLGCMSKLLSLSDSLKPPYHKECLALSLNLKSWEAYILGTEMRITALCDARGVMWLHRNKEFSNKLATISLYISQFKNLVIWHIPGTQNQLADIFSRSYHGSAHKTKEDFKLSREQANRLPPLTDPCVLSHEDLFKIFTTLPQSETDFDTGNRRRRPLPNPKPLLNIMKSLEDSTPEEKFVSARRILNGWNDTTIEESQIMSSVVQEPAEPMTIKKRLRALESEIENTYINELEKYINSTNHEPLLTSTMNEIKDNISQPAVKIERIHTMNSYIPQNVQETIKDETSKKIFQDKNEEHNKIQFIKITDTQHSIHLTQRNNVMTLNTNNYVSIAPFETHTFNTGFVVKRPRDVSVTTTDCIQGLNMRIVSNWRVDTDELSIQLRNITDNTISLHKGDKIGKLTFNKSMNDTKQNGDIHEVDLYNYKLFLDTITPDNKTIDHTTGHKITLPKTAPESILCLNSLQEADDMNNMTEEIALNIAKLIKDYDEKEDTSNLQEEKMMAAMCDIFENKGKLSSQTLGRFQNSDIFCGRIKNNILKGNEQPSYRIIKEVLVKVDYDKDRKKHVAKLVIPDDLMPLVCREIHTQRTIHQPITGSMMKFRKHFYNRNLRTHMKRTVDNCIICKYTEKPSGKPDPGPGKTRTLVMENLKPREAVALDLAIGLPLTRTQSCHALTVICLKTNYGQIYPLKSKHAREVCRRFENGWIKHFMAPKYIYADLGSEFAGEMTQLCSKFGITHYSTFPESQQGNRAELMVKAFKNNVKKYIHEYKHNKSDWENILPMLLPKINQSILHQTKSISRELLFFGDEIAMPILELEPDTGNYFNNREKDQETLLLEYDKMRSARKNYYKPREDLQINLRDIVFIKNRRDEHPKSLKVQYVGPMRVSRVYPLGVTAYHMIDGTEMSAHYNHIKKLTLNQYDESMPKNWEADITKLILNVAKAKRTNNIDIIFEEIDDNDMDNQPNMEEVPLTNTGQHEEQEDNDLENMIPDTNSILPSIDGTTYKDNEHHTENSKRKNKDNEMGEKPMTMRRLRKPPEYLNDYVRK